MKYELWQVNDDRIRDVGFRPFDAARRVTASDYHRAYMGAVEAATAVAACDQLFTRFNVDRPADFAGYSMSVADIVVLDGFGTFYCDTFGWRRIAEPEMIGLLIEKPIGFA